MRGFAWTGKGQAGWIEKDEPVIGPLDAKVRPIAVAPCSSDVSIMIEAFFLLKMADRYDCRVTYDGDVPNYLFVSAAKKDRGIFTKSIPLK